MWYFTLKYMNWRNLLQLENNMNEKMLTVLTERAAEAEHGFRGPSETDACSRNTQHLWLWVCLQSHLIVLNKPYPPDFCSAGYVPKHVAKNIQSCLDQTCCNEFLKWSITVELFTEFMFGPLLCFLGGLFFGGYRVSGGVVLSNSLFQFKCCFQK